MPSSITNTYVHLLYFSGVGVSLHGPATVSKCPSSHSQRMSIPNPNLDFPLCRRCGEDFPGRNKSQPLCDPCQWRKAHPDEVNSLIPCLICSAQFEALHTQLCGRCKKNSQAIALVKSQQLGLNEGTALITPTDSVPIVIQPSLLVAPSSDPKALSPAHILSLKNHLRPHSLNPLPSPSSIDVNPSMSSFPLLLNTSTPSSVNYAMHVDTNTQKAVTQANILQS
ncbi:hypothetical protein CROQUDRAFT_651865, partial [Cronartium quercuum f. sp. fusiforme G11]